MKKIFEDLQFLIIETENQVKLTYGLLGDPDPALMERIAAKDDYIDNLKTLVENACFSTLHSPKKRFAEQAELNDLRAIHIICVNLERIADHCVNIGRQTRYLSHSEPLHGYDYRAMFSEIQGALGRIFQVLESRDLPGALEICSAEAHLDQLYKETFHTIMEGLKQGRGAGDSVTLIFIFRYLERIGDALLNIGEALIFAIIGERIKIRQFNMLKHSLMAAGLDGSFDDIELAAGWGDPSACRTRPITRKRPAGFKAQGIFKEGHVARIRQEQENIRRWEAIFPGLVPRIFGHYEKQERASLLVEFLSGCTLDQVILTEPSDVIRNVIYLIEQTVIEAWRCSSRPSPAGGDAGRRLADAMQAMLRVYPGFRRPEQAMGHVVMPSTRRLVAAVQSLSAALVMPFTVFVHGNLSTNNIFYNHEAQCIHFVDLHQSRDGDYATDVGMFLASLFRLPVFDPDIRERLNTLIVYFFEFFSDFAERHQDSGFFLRLSIELAAAFLHYAATEINYDFAKGMCHRSLFLMERVAAHGATSPHRFRFPLKALFP